MNNPKSRQEWIYELLKKENTNYVQTWAMYGQKWAKGKTTFDKDWNIANEHYIEYQNKANKAKEEASIAKEVEAVKMGLKTKIERVLELQAQQEKLEKELCNNITVVNTFHNGELITAFRELSPLERTKIHQVIKEIRSEISKIEGDYAPTKTENKHDILPPPPIVEL